MKITIDTKEDSADEIRRAIVMLQTLIGEKSSESGSGDFDTGDESASAFGNMFGDEEEKTTEEKEEKKDTTRVIEY